MDGKSSSRTLFKVMLCNNIDLLQIENSRSFRLTAGCEYAKIAGPNFGSLERSANRRTSDRGFPCSIFFYGLPAGGRGSVVERSNMAHPLRTAWQPCCCSTTSRVIWANKNFFSRLLLSSTVQLTACPVCSSRKTDWASTIWTTSGVCGDFASPNWRSPWQTQRTDRQCEPRKQARHRTGEQLVAGRIFSILCLCTPVQALQNRSPLPWITNRSITALHACSLVSLLSLLTNSLTQCKAQAIKRTEKCKEAAARP